MSLIFNLPNPPLSPPVLSTGFAVGASTLFTLSYVASLYLSPAGRLVAGKQDAHGNVVDRDHPVVIRARIKTATLATALIAAATGVALWVKGVVPRAGWMLDTLNVSRLLGLPLPVPTLLTSHVLPIHPPLPRYLALLATHLLSPLVLTALLFLGPLYTCYLDAELPFQRHFSYTRHVVDRFTSLAGVRNFVVGPLTEELVFRSSILSLLVFAGVERARLIWATPAFFAIAHAHHAYNAFLAGGRTSSAAVRAGVSAAVQLGYTSVFGWYANFLFLRSGSVVPPAVAHVVCNVMGLPNPVDGGDRHKKRRIAIWTAHAAGIALFARFLFPLTSSAVWGPSLYWQ
ncbi:related to CAAX prenyl protease 2 [Sporisorium reilianum f. sp. reilianum]|uniref:intramembrane prenyl-peptidase Rce1 n=1 Tax=Sporisorium reilianum f. sp. reilianum TaxID=72559 RepID=A0A2N8UNN7_9BASI|nr:related to CAAX prenyl protease 2 [Sporisorium reilianum f. sp. reilianum]